MVAWQRLAELADQLDREPRQEALRLDPADDDADPVVDSIVRAEAAQNARQRLQPALRGLDDLHHFVVTRSYGVDFPPMATPTQAAWLLTTVPRVLLLRTEAEHQLRLALVG